MSGIEQYSILHLCGPLVGLPFHASYAHRHNVLCDYIARHVFEAGGLAYRPEVPSRVPFLSLVHSAALQALLPTTVLNRLVSRRACSTARDVTVRIPLRRGALPHAAGRAACTAEQGNAETVTTSERAAIHIPDSPQSYLSARLVVHATRFRQS